MNSIRQRLFWGAFWGCLAWLAYAALEYAAATIAPLLAYKGMTLATWHWKLSLELLAIYALAGAVAGGLLALLAGTGTGEPAKEPLRFQAIGTFTVAAAFLANLLWQVRDVAAVLVCAGMTALLVLALQSTAWRERLRLAANPWFATTALLVMVRTGAEQLHSWPAWMRSTVVLLLLLAFVGTALATSRWWRRPPSPWRHGLVTTGGVLAILFCGLMLDRDAPAATELEKPPAAAASGPNIILISLDTVRADHLSLYGYERPTTPRLQELARSSTLYRQMHAAADMTLPSHAAMFTGTYASWNGAYLTPHAGGFPISAKYPTLPEILSEHGYATAAIVANTAFLRPDYGFDRGFQSFDYLSPLQLLPPDKLFYLRHGVRRLLNRFMCTAEFDLAIRRAGEINHRAFRLLDRTHNNRRPFFLFLNYMDAHSPYVPPPPFDTLFPGKDAFMTYAERLQLGADVAALRTSITSRQREHLFSQYDGAIAYLDSQIGALVLKLKQLGLYDNTLLIVTSDHGEAFGERNLMGHGESVYQDEVCVPLLIKYPREKDGQMVNWPASHVDILPTVLEAAAIRPPAFLQGRSLADGKPGTERVLISESFLDPSLAELHPRFKRTERAIYDGVLKYIGSTASKQECFDLANDPAERHNLWSADQKRCATVQQSLADWVKAIPRHASPGRKPDAQNLQRLKALGYVQ